MPGQDWDLREGIEQFQEARLHSPEPLPPGCEPLLPLAMPPMPEAVLGLFPLEDRPLASALPLATVAAAPPSVLRFPAATCAPWYAETRDEGSSRGDTSREGEDMAPVAIDVSEL